MQYPFHIVGRILQSMTLQPENGTGNAIIAKKLVGTDAVGRAHQGMSVALSADGRLHEGGSTIR